MSNNSTENVEIVQLQSENEELRKECTYERNEKLDREMTISRLRSELDKQAKEIANLKGQIDAYQYALNCRGGR